MVYGEAACVEAPKGELPVIAIETEHLQLRNFTANDWQGLQEVIVHYQASASAQYEAPWPTAAEEIQGITTWFAGGDDYLCVTLKATGAIIGLLAIERRQDAAGQMHNLGYIFHPAYQGQGYALEGCRAIMGYLFDQLAATAIHTGTHPANEPSVRLLTTLGLKRVNEGEFVLSRAEWQALVFAGAPQQGNQRDPIGPLMALLRDSSQDVYGAHVPGRGEFAPRRQAVAELVKLGSLAVEPLCQALQDENGYTRRFAAEALRQIGDPRAVLPLVKALQTSEVYVQRYVADALAVVGDERAVEPLYQALQNPDLAREALLALQAVVERTAATIPTAVLCLVASLPDNGHYIEEVPDTDGGYLSWERVERWLDYRAVKVLAEQELERRSTAAAA
ncbi:MAG: GNAT family N-acetyltransferase [Caldilinea sp. CFX5]|nr:GNAT family N-acetyltransferase [Caldilinea sp. CFX5]